MTQRLDLIALAATGSEHNPPDPQGTADSLRRMGHSLEDALAEIVDNALDAKATSILVRFYRKDSRILRVVIADDGAGMSEQILRQSMQYGVRRSHEATELGKYGIGLKTASFSQCTEITVVSRTKRQAPNGRRWNQSAIADEEWRQQIISKEDCARLFKEDWGPVNVAQSGTLVVWDALDSAALRGAAQGAAMERLFDRLATSLGMTFHRFLDDDDVKIALDVVDLGADDVAIGREVASLNPFGYQSSGNAAYPISFPVRVEGLGSFKVEGHIWPPNSREPNYRLGGGRVASRQGFYVYRNRRLINAGGWFGMRGDSEPHSSLARVRFDLPPTFDAHFHLSVQKNRVQPPEAFLQALETARSGRTSFGDFIQDAQATYRKKPRAPRTTVVAASRSSPRASIAQSDSNPETVIRVSYVWKRLGTRTVFEVSPDRRKLVLNSRFRRDIGDSLAGTFLKTLLLHALSAHLGKQRVMTAERELVRRINAELLKAIKG